MKIKVNKMKWHSAEMGRQMRKLADHVLSHYPKDSDMHAMVRGMFRATNETGNKLAKAKATTKPAAKAPKKRTVAKRRKPMKTTRAKATTPKRRTAAKRRTPAKRRTVAKRRTMTRRTTRRRAA